MSEIQFLSHRATPYEESFSWGHSIATIALYESRHLWRFACDEIINNRCNQLTQYVSQVTTVCGCPGLLLIGQKIGTPR